jgi:predicted Fe-Mo cluster-binding NifX family protein
MRIAIAAMTRDEDSKISRHGARAEYYLVYDEHGKLCDVIENPFKDYDRAVGVRVADYLADKKIDIVAAANFGSGFSRALEAKGIRHVESEGTIRKAATELAERHGTA